MGTLTLIDELTDVCQKTSRVSPTVTGALGRLLEASEDLKKQITLRERAGSQRDPKARAADRALDDAWGALQSWLLGWTKLPDGSHPNLQDARALYAALFPKGLQFLTLDFKDEWTESQNRVAQIVQLKLDLVFVALGGGAFLENLLRAHRSYGEALHITEGSSSSPEPDSLVRRALSTVHMALREYVAQVAATVRRTEPPSVATAAILLGPLSARAAIEGAPDDVTMASPR